MSHTVFLSGTTVYDTVTVSLAGTDVTADGPVAHLATLGADTATAFGVSAVHSDLVDDDIFILPVVLGTITISITGTDIIVHVQIAPIAAVVADTASAVDIDFASDTFFIPDTTVNDIVTVSLAGTDATAHGPIAYREAVVAVTASAADINLADDDTFIFREVFDTFIVSLAYAHATAHEPVARITAVAAPNATVTRNTSTKNTRHARVAVHIRMEPTAR